MRAFRKRRKGAMRGMSGRFQSPRRRSYALRPSDQGIRAGLASNSTAAHAPQSTRACIARGWGWTHKSKRRSRQSRRCAKLRRATEGNGDYLGPKDAKDSRHRYYRADPAPPTRRFGCTGGARRKPSAPQSVRKTTIRTRLFGMVDYIALPTRRRFGRNGIVKEQAIPAIAACGCNGGAGG